MLPVLLTYSVTSIVSLSVTRVLRDHTNGTLYTAWTWYMSAVYLPCLI